MITTFTTGSFAKKLFCYSFTQNFLSLILIVGLFGKIFFFDGLGRRIQTKSQGNTINYYYDPEVEFLELGHSVNGNRQWNLYGPDRSGVYGGAQGIGGLETCFTENTKSSFGIVNNYFGDVVGLMSGGHFTPYSSALGSYGPMPGSSVNQALQPQWRGHYIDNTGLYCMGARYYDPQSGRFISPDPLGHSSSLGLYDYCDGDPVNGLDVDGRCVEGGVKGYTMGTFAEYDNTAQAIGGFLGTLGSYATPGLGEAAFVRDVAGSAWHGLQAVSDMYHNGLNWRNGTQLGLSAVGVGAGSFAALAPTKAAVEAIASTTSSSEITPFETMLAKVDELDFSTPRNGAVFYSGPGQGIRAASFATRTGGMTIDMTSGGQWLRGNLDVLSRAEQDLIWKRASIPFAKGASGKINAFIHGASPERAFRTIEEPILNANPNVYNSTYYY